jgi:hypothetical protein
MQDYRLDAIERPERHPAAVDRLTGRGPSAVVDYSGCGIERTTCLAGLSSRCP